MTELRTPRLLLRPWIADDAGELIGAFSDAATMQFWNSPPARDVDELKAWIEQSRAVPADYHRAWSIVLVATGAIVGMVNYHHRDARNARAELGWIVIPSHRRLGIAGEAVGALIDHCFDELRIQRVEAQIDPANIASLRFAERLGFHCEGGPLRSRVHLAGGRFGDVMMYGLLKADRFTIARGER